MSVEHFIPGALKTLLAELNKNMAYIENEISQFDSCVPDVKVGTIVVVNFAQIYAPIR